MKPLIRWLRSREDNMKRFMWWHVYVLRHKVTSDITAGRLLNMCWDCPEVWVYT